MLCFPVLALLGWAASPPPPPALAHKAAGWRPLPSASGEVIEWRAVNASIGFVRRRLSTHRVPMNGACAVVARENVYVKDTKKMVMNPVTGEMEPKGEVLSSAPMWDYRIKVDPWQVFGEVELDIMGQNVEVEHVWAASVVSMSTLGSTGPHGGVRVKLELDMQPQDDQQFDIDGVGTPSANPTIVRCRNLEPPVYACKLNARYTMLNSFETRVSSKVYLETWQQGAKVKIDFGTTAVRLSEVWGAQVIEDDDMEPAAVPAGRQLRGREEAPATANGAATPVAALVAARAGEAAAAAAGPMKTQFTFRLMPFNHHMPTDRRSCFGFDSSPMFHSMPMISCTPVLPFPPPPPPSPPAPPPAPPPYLQTERGDCFLGGRVEFVTTPSSTPGTLWEVSVHLDRWLMGSQLTLDFFGEQLRAHPLRIASFQPDGTVLQVGLTYHSVMLELRNAPVHEFTMQAYGLPEGLGRLACCCAEMPSPPPPPPSPPPDPRPPPELPHMPPSPVGMSDSEWGRGIIGGESRLFPSPPPMQVDIVKPSAVKNTMHTAAVVLGLGLAGYCAMKVRQAHQRRARQPHRLKLMAGGRPMAIPTADASDDEERATTKLHIEVSATDRCALKISMGSISTMEDLQELVAEVREVAGYVEGHLIAPHGH